MTSAPGTIFVSNFGLNSTSISMNGYSLLNDFFLFRHSVNHLVCKFISPSLRAFERPFLFLFIVIFIYAFHAWAELKGKCLFHASLKMVARKAAMVVVRCHSSTRRFFLSKHFGSDGHFLVLTKFVLCLSFNSILFLPLCFFYLWHF